VNNCTIALGQKSGVQSGELGSAIPGEHGEWNTFQIKDLPWAIAVAAARTTNPLGSPWEWLPQDKQNRRNNNGFERNPSQ
jgi:hypothetical protein